MCGEALFWLLAAQGGLGDRPIAAFVAQLTGRGQGFLRVPGKARGAFPLADESVTSGPQKNLAASLGNKRCSGRRRADRAEFWWNLAAVAAHPYLGQLDAEQKDERGIVGPHQNQRERSRGTLGAGPSSVRHVNQSRSRISRSRIAAR